MAHYSVKQSVMKKNHVFFGRNEICRIFATAKAKDGPFVSGLGRKILILVTRVRFPYGLLRQRAKYLTMVRSSRG